MADQTDGFPDRGPAVFAVTTATLVLASVFVASRLISRIGIVRHVTYDDYLIVIAWLIAFFLSFTIDLGTRRGLGRHDVNIEAHKEPGLRTCEYVFSILYNPALMATKTSILVFYLRLSKNTQKVLRLASWIVLVIVNLAGTILTFMNIFQCSPVDGAWNPTVKASCIPLLTEFICSAPVNIVTDVAILALPIPVITGMRLPPRQKTILVITFALGVFVTVVDVVRIYYLQRAISHAPTFMSDDSSNKFGDTEDFAWNASLSLMWSAVEVNVGITCACIPTLKPLIIRILPAMLVDPDGTRRASNDSKVPSSATPNQDSSDNSQPRAATGVDPIMAAHEAHVGGGRVLDEEVSIRDFLRGTATNADGTHRGSVPTQSDNRGSVTSAFGAPGSAQPENAIYFGFVNMKRPKSMLRVSAGESFKYCTVVTILFLLWGFSYGLLNTLNNVIAALGDISVAKTLGLTSAYFGGGYFFGPLLVGEWLLRHDEHHRSRRGQRKDTGESIGGFRVTFIVGLLIYGTGTIMFWPSAVLNAYGGFMVSNFVVGFGLGVLETAANPFLALCGPADYSEMRLLLAQGVQGIGSVASGILAQKVFFKQLSDNSITNSMSLLSVQWTYLSITLFCALLALFFYYMPLPEVTDKELGRLAASLLVAPKKRSIGGLSLRTWCIILAVAAQWTYVAAQESMSIWFRTLVTGLLPAPPATNTTTGAVKEGKPQGLALDVPDYLCLSHTAFAVSRFAAGYLAYLSVKYPKHHLIPTPRMVLAFSVALNILFGILIVVLKPKGNPNLLVIPIVLFFFAEGPIWPLIFALGLRGQGGRTKRAAAWLTMGGSGPAFWPFVIYAVFNRSHSIYTGFIVVVALLAVTFIYPLFLTFIKDAKYMVDPPERVHKDSTAAVLATRHRQPSEVNLDEIIASRRRTAGGGGGGEKGGRGLFHKPRPGLSFGFGSKSRRPTVASAGAQSPLAVDHREEGEGEQSRAAPLAPWEAQELDTSILQE